MDRRTRLRVSGEHYTISLDRALPPAFHVSAPKVLYRKAVERNREKRRCKAVFRGRTIPFQCIVRVTRSTAGISFASLNAEAAELLRKLGL